MIKGLFLVVLSVFNGVTVMTVYTANIFEATGSTLSPNMSSIVVGAIQLLGTCVAINLVERVGRKV